MPVVIVHQGPTLTQDRYEQAVARLSGGKSRMESRADWPVDGLIFHAAGQSESGFRVVDVWESEEAVQRLADMLTPIMDEVGITDVPEIYPAHTFVSS